MRYQLKINLVPTAELMASATPAEPRALGGKQRARDSSKLWQDYYSTTSTTIELWFGFGSVSVVTSSRNAKLELDTSELETRSANGSSLKRAQVLHPL